MASVTPPTGYIPPQGGASGAAPVDGDTVPADITRLPPTLAATDRAITLRGEVVQQNDDGTTRIATPRGAIDVRLPDPQPARGTDVEINLPAGTPPRTAGVTLPAVQAQASTVAAQLETPPAVLPGLQNTALQNTAAATPQTQGAQNQGAQAPAATQTPVTQNPTLDAGATQSINPRGLLDFLKTSMQNLVKGSTTDASPAQAGQRPLQMDQLARLTPLPAGQATRPLAAPGLPNATTQPSGTQPSGTQASGTQVPGLAPQHATTLNAQQTALPQSAATSAAPRTISVAAAQTSAAPAQMPANQSAIATAANNGIANLTPAAATAAGPLPANLALRILAPLTPAQTPAQTPTPATIPTTSPSAAPTAPATVLPQSLPPIAAAIHARLPVLPGQTVIAAPAGAVQTPMPQALDVRVAAIMPMQPAGTLPGANVATLLHGTPATPSLFANVTGQTAQGLPVVELPTFTTLTEDGLAPHTAPATMVLQFPAKGLGASTALRLDVLTSATATATSAAAQAAPQTTINWDAFDDILQTRPGQTPITQAAQAAIIAALPKPDAGGFAAPVMMFVSALRGGDIAAWLGERGLDAIGRGARKADALARIAGDFAASARKLGTEDAKPAGDWRSIQLPFLAHEGEVSRIALHYRGFERDAYPGETPGRKTGTRFVMDLTLTRMGPMQVDGFSTGRRLDVTLRSEKNLSPAMREAMRVRYANAVANIGFAGDLNFSAAPDRKGWATI
ncbi:MAG: hypothetical protein H6865_05645 [Rhodospirillales bacterium]|nr:hypothetical protein [Rhodospirillales bacterium]USO08137.1 MAG: hypothetical protein H6866_02650 [Rhodospirillales bacterium]